MVKRLIALSMLSVCLSLQAVRAQAPSTIGYQGVLTDNNGVAVANGSYSLSFSLYTAASGGSPLWTETQSVTTTSGVFNAVLGSVTPLNVAFNQPLYLGISVGGTELSPRIALAVLIEAVKEQQREIEALKARVEAVERPHPLTPSPTRRGGTGLSSSQR